MSANDFEAERTRRIAANAAKLAQLDVKSAASSAVAARQRVQQAERDELLGGSSKQQRRQSTSRAAAAKTKAKLQQQAAQRASDDEDASSSEPEQPAARAVSHAAAEYDPLDDAREAEDDSDSSSMDAEPSDSDADAEGGSRLQSSSRLRTGQSPQPSPAAVVTAAADSADIEDYGKVGPALGDSAADDDAQLQRALELSMMDAATAMPSASPGAAARRTQPESRRVATKPAAAKPSAAKAAVKKATPKATRKPAPRGEAQTKPQTAGKKKAAGKGRQTKRQRTEAQPLAEEDVVGCFQLFNRQGMSAVIACDVDKVATDTLGVDLDGVQLNNMMTRAADVLDLKHPRLTLEDFRRLMAHYCS